MHRATHSVLFFTAPLFFLMFASLLASAVDLQVAQATCGTTIPADSQWLFDPVWSAALLRRQLTALSAPEDNNNNNIINNKNKDNNDNNEDNSNDKGNAALRFVPAAVSAAVAALVSAESGMAPRGVLLFALDATRRPAERCAAQWSPLLAGMGGTEATAARVTVLGGCGCDESARLEIEVNGKMLHALPVKRCAEGQAHSVSFATAGVRWPVKLRVTGNCTTHMLLLTARHGSLHHWYAWIPATVYTVVVVLLVVVVSLFQSRVSSALTITVATLVYLGYIGSCIGLLVELICWQSAVGRMFPFPPAVTFYICLPLIYLMLFFPLFARHPHRGLLARAVLSLAVYGMNCALGCGYWIAGLVVLGIPALVQYVAVNVLLTLAYSYFCVVLDRSGLLAEPLSKSAGILWFAPLTPFIPCALIYYNLFIVEENTRRASPASASIVEAVTLYNVITAVPKLLLENVWGIALLIAATVYHMPFIVVLFGASFLFLLHFLLALSDYLSARRRWKERGLFAQSQNRGSCWRPLWPAVEQCVKAARASVIQEEERMLYMESVIGSFSLSPRARSVFSHSRNEPMRRLPHRNIYSSEAPAELSLREASCFSSSTIVCEEEEYDNDSPKYWPTKITA